MPSRKTYRWSASSKKFKEDKDGEFDADGDKITTYRLNSKKNLVRSLDGNFDENGNAVTEYKYCYEDKEFRRHVGGEYNQKYVDDVLLGKKPAPKKSGITAGIKQQKREAGREEDRVAIQNQRDRLVGAAEARQSGNRGESSRTSTGGGSGRPPRALSTERRRRQSPSGHALPAEVIEEQDEDDIVAAVELYGDGPVVRPQRANARTSRPNPPGYEEHRKDPKLTERGERDELFAEGLPNRNLPGYSSQPSSPPGPTGLTPKLGKSVSKDAKPPATFGGRYDPAAPPGYSSEELNKRGNKSITSGSDGANREYTSGSEDFFTWSPEGKPKPKGVHKPKATPKRGDSSKAAELAPKKKSSAEKAPAKNPSTSRPLSSDSSLGDTDDSPPKFLAQQGRSRTGDRGSSKRETSTERRKGKMPVRTKGDPAKRSSSRRRHESSDPDSLYGS